jgi:5-formyltetrahydrofolate cyclo-ligase
LNKSQLRRHFAELRRSFAASEMRSAADRAICRAIRGLADFYNSPGVAGFVAFGAEVDLSELFTEVPFYLPQYDRDRDLYQMARVRDFENDLVIGKYGIPEPRQGLEIASESERISLLYLVPAVACDRSGTRLGRGGGYYDRILQGVKSIPSAVIYHCQLSESPLPCEEHDLPMGRIITEKEIVTCS